jgi:hypothetical protein
MLPIDTRMARLSQTANNGMYHYGINTKSMTTPDDRPTFWTSNNRFQHENFST